MQMFAMVAALLVGGLAGHQMVNREALAAKIGFAVLLSAAIAGFVLAWLKL